MRVENLFVSNQYDGVGIKGKVQGAKQSDAQQKTGQELVDDAVSMEISKKGYALAGELEPFLDTYETTRTLLDGIGHIGSEEMMNGDFADTIAKNYQNELQKLKENYSGEEYDKQLAILDKAYEEAVQSATNGYVKQLKLLSGDIVIKPQSAPSYATEAEAEKAYQEQLKKDEERKPVIDDETADAIQKNLKNILFQLKDPAYTKNDFADFFKTLFAQYASVNTGA